MKAILRCIYILVFLLFSVSLMYCSRRQSEDVASTSRVLAQIILPEPLEQAKGYAVIFNVPKAEELCDSVLSKERNPEIIALCHWIKAVAYATFQLEYRTNCYEQKLQSEIEDIKRLKPELLTHELIRLQTQFLFYVPEEADEEKVDRILAEERQVIASKAEPSASELFRLGIVNQTAHDLYLKLDQKQKAESCRQEAVKYIGEAYKRRKDIYEYSAFYVTALAENNNIDQAIELAENLRNTFAEKFAYLISSDAGPNVLYSATVSQKDTNKSYSMLKTWIDEGLKDPWVYYELAITETTRAPEASRPAILEKLARQFENGEIPIQGSQLRALARTYYQLAYYQYSAGKTREALEAYKKLEKLSPHYADLQYDIAVVLGKLSEEEDNAERKSQLLEDAKTRLQEQMNYNWHGKTITHAKGLLNKLEAKKN
jgi:tetratricopeptide (TPR) repeat protein